MDEAGQETAPLIVLFTDFGHDGPYIGQMMTAIHAIAPKARVIDLMADAPRFDPKASAYLLAALVTRLPEDAVCVGVIDPGVGSERPGVIVEAGDRFFVGPGNGLFEIVRRRAAKFRTWTLREDPAAAPSFHGRDIFAPTAARLSLGTTPGDLGARSASPADLPGRDWPDDLAEVIYFDHYGNAMTGLRAAEVDQSAMLRVTLDTDRQFTCRFARTFSAAPRGAAFWYENSNGLVEIAVNGGSARDDLGLGLGLKVDLA